MLLLVLAARQMSMLMISPMSFLRQAWSVPESEALQSQTEVAEESNRHHVSANMRSGVGNMKNQQFPAQAPGSLAPARWFRHDLVLSRIAVAQTSFLSFFLLLCEHLTFQSLFCSYAQALHSSVSEREGKPLRSRRDNADVIRRRLLCNDCAVNSPTTFETITPWRFRKNVSGSPMIS